MGRARELFVSPFQPLGKAAFPRLQPRTIISRPLWGENQISDEACGGFWIAAGQATTGIRRRFETSADFRPRLLRNSFVSPFFSTVAIRELRADAQPERGIPPDREETSTPRSTLQARGPRHHANAALFLPTVPRSLDGVSRSVVTGR